jgi:hypothetical protein
VQSGRRKAILIRDRVKCLLQCQDAPMTPDPVNVISHLYRFRPIESLLSGYNELENQEIYFAHPDELNDPMEGLKDIFWRGDEIVWKNLFKHYLVCLNVAWCLLVLCGEEQPLGWDKISVLNFDAQGVTPEQKTFHDEIFAKFFSEEAIRSYIEELSTRSQPIRRNELAAHFQFIHPFAISTICECYERRGLPKNPIRPELQASFKNVLAEAKKVASLIKKLEAEYPNNEFAIETFFTSHQQLTKQLEFISRYNGAIDTSKPNKNFVFLNFCDDYVKKIESLVYSDWYTACFMSDCSNSSVWGNYGDGHTGVCLKFKVNTTKGLPLIRLNRLNGYGGSGPLHMDVEHGFFEVNYEKSPVPIDFFRSLGRIPVPQLQRYWYSDENGRRSPCADAIFKSEDEWRKKYWENLNISITTKLKDWNYEHEYRLVLTSALFDFSDKKLRKVKYDFNDLEGIIFGIKTDSAKKLEMCKIVEEKCRKSGRTDFKFYQAFYSREKGTIEHSEMGLLKFKR